MPAPRLDTRGGMHNPLQPAEEAILAAILVQDRVPEPADDAVVALQTVCSTSVTSV